MSAPVNVTIKVADSKDWIEVIVDGESKFRGHPTDLDHEDLLRYVMVEANIIEDAPMAPDGRSFL